MYSKTSFSIPTLLAISVNLHFEIPQELQNHNQAQTHHPLFFLVRVFHRLDQVLAHIMALSLRGAYIAQTSGDLLTISWNYQTMEDFINATL